MRRILALLTFVLAAALPAAGQVIPTITGNSITLTISRPGGLSAELSLSFEEVTGLSLANIGLSAQVVNPNNPALLARLPAGVSVGLPVLLRIEPPVPGGLSFRGIASLGLHTENLQYTPGTPLRLFHAPIGGAFEDMTSYMGAGSYRVRGSSGGFSEFLIVADARTVDQVIANKFDRLEEELDEYGALIPALLYEDLSARLAEARTDYEHGATLDAVQNVDGFLILVQQHSGEEIPDVWRSARDLQNVAGYLRAEALTLRFSLELKRAAGH